MKGQERPQNWSELSGVRHKLYVGEQLWDENGEVREMTENDLVSLGDAYRLAFGEKPWNEGFRHKKRGYADHLSISKWESLSSRDQDQYEPYYPQDELETMWAIRMMNNENGLPILSIVKSLEPDPRVLGFAYGRIVDSVKGIEENLLALPCFVQAVKKSGRVPENIVKEIWDKSKILEGEKVFFWDDLGNVPGERGELIATAGLAYEMLKRAEEEGATESIIATTNMKSVIGRFFGIAKRIGVALGMDEDSFEIIHQERDGDNVELFFKLNGVERWKNFFESIAYSEEDEAQIAVYRKASRFLGKERKEE